MRLVIAVLAAADGDNAVVVRGTALRGCRQDPLEILAPKRPELGRQRCDAFGGTATRADSLLVNFEIYGRRGIDAACAVHRPFRYYSGSTKLEASRSNSSRRD